MPINLAAKGRTYPKGAPKPGVPSSFSSGGPSFPVPQPSPKPKAEAFKEEVKEPAIEPEAVNLPAVAEANPDAVGAALDGDVVPPFEQFKAAFKIAREQHARWDLTMAKLLKAGHAAGYHLGLGYSDDAAGWRAFCEVELGFSGSRGYDMLAIARAYEDTDEATVSKVGYAKAREIARLPEKSDREELLEKAASEDLTVTEVKAEVAKRKDPEGTGGFRGVRATFSLTAQQSDIVDAAVDLSMKKTGGIDRGAALHRICIEWMVAEGHLEEQG